MSQLWQIFYPCGDRTKLTVGLVWDYERNQYDLASEERFEDKDAATDLARRLAARYGLRLDPDEFEMPAYLTDEEQDSDDLIARIRAEIRDYHYSKDLRCAAGFAQEAETLENIQKILGMRWEPNAEKERREDRTQPFRDFTN